MLLLCLVCVGVWLSLCECVFLCGLIGEGCVCVKVLKALCMCACVCVCLCVGMCVPVCVCVQVNFVLCPFML